MSDPIAASPLLDAGPASPSSPAGEARLVGAGLCALSAAGFATLSILGKVAYAQGLSMTGFLSLRFGGAALLLGAYLALTRGRALFPGRRLALILFALGAVGYFTQSSLYFLGLSRVSASLSSLLLYVYPMFVALLAWAVNRRPPAGREWAAMALALAGVVLTISPGAARDTAAHLDPLGVTFVLASAAAYAAYIVTSDRFAHRAGALVSTAWIAAGAACSFAAAGALTRSWVMAATPQALGILLALIVFSTILPLVTFLAGMARVGPTAASLLSTLEPVFTVLLAAGLLRESLMPLQAVGGGLVLAAVVLLNLPRRAPARAEA